MTAMIIKFLETIILIIIFASISMLFVILQWDFSGIIFFLLMKDFFYDDSKNSG